MSDLNIRKLIIPKFTYSKYCSKCKFCVKAEWSRNEGVKYGMLNVYCCVNGGSFPKPICPHGIAWWTPLGTEQTFNPEDWGPERFNKKETFTYTLEEPKGEREPSKQRKL